MHCARSRSNYSDKILKQVSVKVSYIIITWNGLPLLKRLLGSMSVQMKRTDVEVIVVDNGSEDGSTDYIRTEYPTIRLIENPENKGVAYARNRALEVAEGKYLFILDNDIVINDTAVEGMERYMDENEDAGLCGCKLTGSDGEVQESCKPYPGIMIKVRNVVLPDRQTFYYKEKMNGEPFEPVYVIGACQMIRRETLENVGLLDENIFYGPEDADYCLRVSKAGWKVMYLPQFTMQHLCQRKTTKKPFSPLGRKHIKALMYFYWKYKKL